jgi:hypothetical protein
MAERRMFAKTIIDSDAFLDMPLSTQALYFHLSMRADDDGFINNPKKIQRIIGSSDDDAKLLVLKKFIIPFESGVVVIKHWKIHNYIQKDRYKETLYKEEKALLSIKENKSYTLEENPPALPEKTECIHDVYNTDTQDRLGKDSLEENRERVDYQLIVELFNDTCVSFPRLITLSDKRKKAIKARLKTYSLDDFKRLFEKAEASNFLKGANERNWSANFDWLIKDSNMAKVLEGNYDNKKAAPRKNHNTISRQHDMDALERMLLNAEEKPKTAADDEALRERAEALRQQLA